MASERHVTLRGRGSATHGQHSPGHKRAHSSSPVWGGWQATLAQDLGQRKPPHDTPGGSPEGHDHGCPTQAGALQDTLSHSGGTLCL